MNTNQDIEVLRMVYDQACRDFNACTNYKMIPILERMVAKASYELRAALAKKEGF